MLGVEPVEVHAFFFLREDGQIGRKQVDEAGDVELTAEVEAFRWREARVETELIERLYRALRVECASVHLGRSCLRVSDRQGHLLR